MTKTVLTCAALVMVSGLVIAKLPALDDAAKAKAAETAAKAAWQGKVDGYLVCKVQDKLAAAYGKNKAVPKAAKDVKPAAPAVAAATAAQPAASGTPIAFAPPPPCADPGPFAYNPPEQKPLETSGAHSPAGNATSPPSVKQSSAEMVPAKK